MCIAIIVPAGKKLPEESILRRCFTKNKDGAGFVYAKGGACHFAKGFMDIESFLVGIKEIPEGAPCLLHFRIGTHGGMAPGHTHPFPMTSHVPSLFMLSGVFKGDMVVHNGIISGYGDAKGSTRADGHPSMSDTQEFIFTWNQGKLTDDKWHSALSGSRFARITKEGEISKSGSWEEEDGIFYSNSGYKPYVAASTCDPRGWVYDEDGNWIGGSSYSRGSDDGSYYSGRKKHRRYSSATQGVEFDWKRKSIETRLGISADTMVLLADGSYCTVLDLTEDYGIMPYSLEMEDDMLYYRVFVGCKSLLPLGVLDLPTEQELLDAEKEELKEEESKDESETTESRSMVGAGTRGWLRPEVPCLAAPVIGG